MVNNFSAEDSYTQTVSHFLRVSLDLYIECQNDGVPVQKEYKILLKCIQMLETLCAY